MMKMRPTVVLFVAVVAVTAHAEQRCDTASYPLSTPTERFTDNGDGTVLDSASDLVWMRCSVGQTWADGRCGGEPARLTWAEANAAADPVNQGGAFFFNDWRMPSLRDLALIAERQCEDPRINLSVFPDTPADFYWTASTRPVEGFADGAYALSFGAEGVQHRPKEDAYHVRLVRTGP